jgi:DNA replication protein DnaC
MTVEIDFSDENPFVPTGPPPPDKEIECAICKKPLRARHHWIISRWMHGTVHERCAAEWERSRVSGHREEVKIPDRFGEWDLSRFPHKRAFSEAQSFEPDSRLKTLIIMGPPGSGKSRLMWNIVAQFFNVWASERRQSRWVEYLLFTDLMTDYDQSKITKLKTCQFAFVDDIGCTESFGRSRALLQDVIRFRLSTQKWTFLTIDDRKFDPDLIDNAVRDRAKLVIIDE